MSIFLLYYSLHMVSILQLAAGAPASCLESWQSEDEKVKENPYSPQLKGHPFKGHS